MSIQKGQRFINLRDEMDADEDDQERITPAGSVWEITHLDADGTIQAECSATGGWIFPDKDQLQTSFIAEPLIYDSGAEQVERYTVFPVTPDAGANHTAYLGCSEGGFAVSMWGELKASEMINGLDFLGERKAFEELSAETQRHLMARLRPDA